MKIYVTGFEVKLEYKEALEAGKMAGGAVPGEVSRLC